MAFGSGARIEEGFLASGAGGSAILWLDLLGILFRIVQETSCPDDFKSQMEVLQVDL